MRLLAFAFTIVFVWTGPKRDNFVMVISCSFDMSENLYS